MTRDIGAGGHSLPYRWRPMDWTVEDNATEDATHYLNERATATQQTGFWFVGQARNWVPVPVAGILWFGTDDTATSPLTPIYTSATEIPWCFSTENGSMMEYSDSSMFWLTNRIANFAYLRYDMISADIRKRIDRWENLQIAKVKSVDDAATGLFDRKPAKAVKFLTEYSVDTAQKLFSDWQKLDQYLLVKYIDGNVKKENADGTFKDNGNGANIPEMPDFPGYDERWRRNVAASDDGTLRVK
jgi:dipeptidase